MHEGNHAIPCSLVYLNQPFFIKKLAKFHKKVNFKFKKLSDFAHFLVAKGEGEKKPFINCKSYTYFWYFFP
jgi:hypothetical protein